MLSNRLMDEKIFSVRDKVCVITGVSTGLGAHMARVLLTHGAKVIGISRTELEWESNVYGDQFHAISGDVRIEKDMHDVFKKIREVFMCPDVVINNAGISYIEKSIHLNHQNLKDILDINLVAAGSVSQMAAEIMRSNKQGGSIINVSSVMANSAITGLAAYSATKAALEQLSRSFAMEWAKYGIRVNNLAPGWFHTPMTSDFLDKGMAGALKTRIPMGRLGELTDLDGALLLLSSNASKYMTGSTITVDGGYSVVN